MPPARAIEITRQTLRRWRPRIKITSFTDL